MDVLAMILAGIGALILIASGIWYLVITFQKGVWWGLGNLFVPFVGIVFLVIHFRDAWRPFAANIVGIILLGASAAVYLPAHPELLDEKAMAEAAGSNGAQSTPYKPASTDDR